MRDDLQEILLTADQIARRLDELGQELTTEYTGQDLTVVAVLSGTVMFVADLLRRLPIPLRLDYVGLSSYHGETHSSGQVAVTKDLQLDVRDREVLVVDDILDSGLTLVRVTSLLRAAGPRRVRSCVLLEKDIPHADGFRADYVGFHIPDKFVVGYGLDYDERYRNLPDVATLRPEVVRRTDDSPRMNTDSHR
ncbi:hypoxanthine phosphoribosyltransferase [bacterium]|nr:hypoxanthine phosphoribosyltransferase [bacterium]